MKEVKEHALAERRAALQARDAMFASIMERHFGSGTRIRIISTSDISGGNNSLSIRRHDLIVGHEHVSVIEKMPSTAPEPRIALNRRELWLYQEYFHTHRIAFTPRFYGSCSEGSLLQLVFGYIEGTRPNPESPSINRLLLNVLSDINTFSIPPQIPFNRTSLGFMDTKRIQLRAKFLSEDNELTAFYQKIPSHAARYESIKRGLSHGDLHAGNVILSGHNRPFLIDWTRWGDHPVGSDFGKYLLGAAHRNGKFSLRKLLYDYAENVGADLNDVIFSALYTRIGFLLSIVSDRPHNRRAIKNEILHHASALEET